MVMDEKFVEFSDKRDARRACVGPCRYGRDKLAILPEQVGEKPRPDGLGTAHGLPVGLGALHRVHGVEHLAMLVQPLSNSPPRPRVAPPRWGPAIAWRALSSACRSGTRSTTKTASRRSRAARVSS